MSLCRFALDGGMYDASNHSLSDGLEQRFNIVRSAFHHHFDPAII